MNRPKLRQQAMLVVFGDALGFASSIAIAMFLARQIPVEIMGTYREVVYVTGLTVAVGEFGLSSTVYRFWNLGGVRRQMELIRVLFISLSVIGLVVSLLIYFSASLVSHIVSNAELEFPLRVVSAYPLFAIPATLVRPYFISIGAPLKATGFDLSSSILSFMSLAIPALLGYDLASVLVWWLLFACLRFFIVLLLFRDYLTLKGTWWERPLVKDLWTYLWPLQIARVPGYVSAYADQAIMSVLVSTREFAVYSLGAREIPFVGVIGQSIGNVLIPHLVEDVKSGNIAQLCSRWKKACEVTAIATYVVGAFCIWYAAPIVTVLFSAQYVDSSIPFRLFSLLTFLRVVEYAAIAKAFGETKYIAISAAIGAGVTLGLAVPLTYVFSFSGMAAAVVLGQVCSATYLLMINRTLLKRTLSNFFPLWDLIGIAAIAFVSVGGASTSVGPFLDVNVNDPIMRTVGSLLLLAVASMVLYASLLGIFGYFKFTTLSTSGKMVIERLWRQR